MRVLRKTILEKLVGNQEAGKKRFDDILETIEEVLVGFMNSSNDYDIGKINLPLEKIESLERLSSKRIGLIAKELGLIDINLNFSDFSNKEFRKLFDTIEMELDQHIKRNLYRYSPELFITNMMFFASIISYITFTAHCEDELEIDLEDKLLTTGGILQLIRKTSIKDIRAFLKEIKSAVEYSINYVLLDEFSMSENSRTEDIDYLEVLILFYAKSSLFQLRELIPLLNEKRGEISLEVDGVHIPYFFIEGFNNYAEVTRDKKIRVENDLTTKLFELFQQQMGFQPSNLVKYISTSDENRAFRIYDNFVSIADKELLLWDMMLNQKLTLSGSSNIIEFFTLNDKKFYNTKSAAKYVESKNNRLFRTPIIEVENKLILPTYSWIESIHYLSHRILNRDIKMKKDQHNWNELIKSTYDEYDIPKLKGLLEYQGYIVGTNWDLAKDPKLKKCIESVKEMPHEIDLYYIKNNKLLIFDVKNYGMQHSFSDAKKLVDKVYKEKKKLKKLKDFILSKKEFFEKRLGFSFSAVSLGIITVDPTIYKFFVEKEDGISVISMHDFGDQCKR